MKEWTVPESCVDCGRADGRGGSRCARCYMRQYRATENGRARSLAAQRSATRRLDPRKRRRWVNTWRERVGLFVPDLGELRRAINRLEYAVAETTDRQAVRGADQ